jgi:hypothetical protein
VAHDEQVDFPMDDVKVPALQLMQLEAAASE